MKLYLTGLLLTICSWAIAQQGDTLLLKKLLNDNPDLFSGILSHPTHNEVQILYTQIDRDRHNNPHFTSYSYRLNPNHYFYPASSVKLPTVIFALEKINELKVKGLNKSTTMLNDSNFTGQNKMM